MVVSLGSFQHCMLHANSDTFAAAQAELGELPNKSEQNAGANLTGYPVFWKAILNNPRLQNYGLTP